MNCELNVTITEGMEFTFYPDNNTHKGVNATGQNNSYGVITLNNNLTRDLEVYLKLNETNSKITLKICNTSNYSNSVALTTSYQLLYPNLTVGNTTTLWAWADYDNPIEVWYPELDVRGVCL